MDTTKLKKFAQFARRTLMGQVSAKLESVLAPGAAARREHPEAMRKLEAAIARDGKGQVIERVAYTWFNRFSALRFMDVNDLNPVRVVSPLSGQFQPEILAEAKAGNIDGDRVPEKVRAQVRALLDGRTPSPDAQAEAYRLVLVAICNDWHRVMPFLFERIDDYTELLLPEDLLSNASILAYFREAMTPDVCEDVEVIGWLYQFYISEKKDEVFAGLKKNVKIRAENIPAATQLFTPHWIVRYLVENSLGRLWLLNRPSSGLMKLMDYYIAPENSEADFLRITSPAEIKVCDPACGSGHMLTYAFDLLYAIYEEEGYDAAEIPSLILANNLRGIEIDDRAGALAAFALAMKAAAKLGRRRFLRMEVKPDVVVLQNIAFTSAEMEDVAAVVGRDLFTDKLGTTLNQFEQANNFGSLIVPKLRDPAEVARVVRSRDFAADLLLSDVQERVLKVLEMAEALTCEYHVVVANPPYAGSSGLNGQLQAFAKANYPIGKADLFAMFMERSLLLSVQRGFVGMINMQSWMFLSSYEKLRHLLLSNSCVVGLVHIGYNSFPELNSKVAQAVAFVVEVGGPRLRGAYIDLNSAPQSADKHALFKRKIAEGAIYWKSTEDFSALPGSPIVYWVGARILKVFEQCGDLGAVADATQGLITADNNRFLRFWHEISIADFCLDSNVRGPDADFSARWYPYNKGGEFRRWYGNQNIVVNWQNDGREIRSFSDSDGKILSRPQSMHNYFKECVSWSDVTTAHNSFRFYPRGFINDATGHSAFGGDHRWRLSLLAYLNTKFVGMCAKFLNPTIHFHIGYFNSLPYAQAHWGGRSEQIAIAATKIAKSDWDAYETSWHFSALPLLEREHRNETLEGSYAHLREHLRSMAEETQQLEEENNRILIDAYDLREELTPEVPLDEITLTCNPAYRYGQASEAEMEGLLLADTMREFVSYAVGCMFGRYSLDAPGLVLANQGEELAQYRAKVPRPTFEPDPDNVIPVLDGDWFADDITDRFRRFLRVTFGDEHFQENLAFVEEALGKDIRRYFTRDFFNDHVKRYKKRPIYWLFSSPKGTFNALIYMHRYRRDTVSVVLNDYLREFRSKLEAYRRAQEALSIRGDASSAQKTKALKEIETTARQIEELDAWERDVLFPLATQKVEINLDDGVKANYPKFGSALKPIKGLNDSDD